MPDRTFRPSVKTEAERKYLIATFISKALATVLALYIAIIWVGPFLLMVVTSLKPNAEFLRGPGEESVSGGGIS